MIEQRRDPFTRRQLAALLVKRHRVGRAARLRPRMFPQVGDQLFVMRTVAGEFVE